MMIGIVFVYPSTTYGGPPPFRQGRLFFISAAVTATGYTKIFSSIVATGSMERNVPGTQYFISEILRSSYRHGKIENLFLHSNNGDGEAERFRNVPGSEGVYLSEFVGGHALRLFKHRTEVAGIVKAHLCGNILDLNILVRA